MFLFIYDLPHWLMGVVVVGAAVFVSLAAYFAFRRLWPLEFSDDDRSLALAVLGIVATVNSLLLAFSAVSVWESFRSADEAVAQEGNSIGSLARDLAVYDSLEARHARRMLQDYTRLVVDKEWQSMKTGESNPEVWRHFDEMFRVIGTVVTLATTFVPAPTRFNVSMIVALAFSIGLVFYFILAMNRPFAGKESISPSAFQLALDNITRWDQTYKTAVP